MPATQIQSTTQNFIDIYDITNDITIMKDGACSLIITVNALNFGLLAEEEQDGIMYSYAGLLNSLNYPVQIVIRSQTKDATNYLNLIREQEMRASTELKKSQIRAYAGFVADLIRERNVLDKKFYIIIPASPLEMGLLPPSTVVPGIKQIDVSTIERSVILDKAKNILEPKRDHLISQFGRIGLAARQLNTQEIIQLFYTSYNPEASEGQQITNSNDYTTPIVTGQSAMPDLGMATTELALPAEQAPYEVPPEQPVQYSPAQEPHYDQPVNQLSEQTVYEQPVTEQAAVEPPIEQPLPAVPQPPSQYPQPVATQVFDASALSAPQSTDTADLQAMIDMSAEQVTGAGPASTPNQTGQAQPNQNLPPLPEI
jgi:hypothetical protein